MSFIKEFKEFATRGNVMDMAVGVIIGGAFGKIVSSLVDDVIMPFVGTLVGKDFTSALNVEINGAMVNFGTFIQNIVDFLIIALCIFIMIKAFNKLSRKKEEPAPEPEPTKEELLLTEIRDLLKKK